MLKMNNIHLVAGFLTNLFDGRSKSAVDLLKQCIDADLEITPSLLRVAAICPGHPSIFYHQIFNFWAKLGEPNLKPLPSELKVSLVSDFTADPLIKPLKLMSASRGVNLDCSTSGFDSVEPVLLDSKSEIYQSENDLVVLILSEHWLEKHLGDGTIVDKTRLEKTKELLASMVSAVLSNSESQLILCTFYQGAWPATCSYMMTENQVGRKVAIDQVNLELLKYSSGRVSVCDTASAVHINGGASVVGRRSYLLAKIAFENDGIIGVSRELATAFSDVCGQTHRACALDWDNTLWGGEIAEQGPLEVVCGHDSPEANAYRLFQLQLKGLVSSGVLLAAVSRNNPEIARSINANSDIPLELDDFSSVQIDFVPKSHSIAQVSAELGFGVDYMLFIDDSTFELAEVLLTHPYIDVFRAEKDPETMLQRFIEGRFFNRVRLEDTDLARSENIRNIQLQREHKLNFKSNEDFLKSINIRLKAEALNEDNRSRILQIIKKSNQFNLSVRRHNTVDIDRIVGNGGDVWAFSYLDDFGGQGIISVVIVTPRDNNYFIDTWLMSCRVLNRTVEYGVFEWLTQKYSDKDIVAEYRLTEKNTMIHQLLEECFFDQTEVCQATSLWLYSKDNGCTPKNFIKFINTGD